MRDWRWFLLLGFMVALGCDHPPPLVTKPSPNLPADVVTDQGRGTYDWRVDKRGFVLRPDEP